MIERVRGFVRPSYLAWIVASLVLASCGDKSSRPAATVSNPPPRVTESEPAPRTQPSPTPVNDPISDPGDTVLAPTDPDDIFSRTLDEINDNSPLEDIRFDFDSAELSAEARRTLERHAEWLGRYTTVSVMISGHCDERGTVAYNLALGERRAMSAYNYLTSLGIEPSRLRTISYGKETPLDPAHTEQAWARNRRGDFEITGR